LEKVITALGYALEQVQHPADREKIQMELEKLREQKRNIYENPNSEGRWAGLAYFFTFV